MTDPRRERSGGTVSPSDSPQKAEAGDPKRAKTAGTNRDFDATDRSENQGHGHPREERGAADQSRG